MPTSDSPSGYRRCVAAAVFNDRGHVFVGCRVGMDPYGDYAWQMPQGGLDKGESPEEGARRELHEETGIHSVELIGQSDDWLTYDYPSGMKTKRAKKHKGQAQLWFAYGFTGDEREINLETHGKAEFQKWDWVPLNRTPALIVPFKRDVYASIVSAFAPIADSWRIRRETTI